MLEVKTEFKISITGKDPLTFEGSTIYADDQNDFEVKIPEMDEKDKDGKKARKKGQAVHIQAGIKDLLHLVVIEAFPTPAPPAADADPNAKAPPRKAIPENSFFLVPQEGLDKISLGGLSYWSGSLLDELYGGDDEESLDVVWFYNKTGEEVTVRINYVRDIKPKSSLGCHSN